jgi:flagella basal body P-ring formation protein FlgA
MIGRLLAPLLLLSGAALAEPPAPLIAELAREAFSLPLPDAARIEVTFQAEPPGEVVLITGFRMNPTTGQFLAEAVLPDGGASRISGLASPLVPVPVPVRPIAAGTVLAEGDLRMAELHAARVGALAALDLNGMIGMEARQALSPGRPVMRQSIAPPVVVRRGDLVTLTLRQGPLSLSVSARAMADAHAGQGVRVVNLSSNQLVEAVASGPGSVRVPGLADPVRP